MKIEAGASPRDATSEQRLPAHLLDSSDAFVALDHDWRIGYLNPAAERVLQAAAGALRGQILWSACSALCGTTFEQQLRRAAGKRERLDVEAFYAPLRCWLEVSAVPWDGGLAVWLRDISERKRRERRELYLQVAAEAIASAAGPRGAMVSFARAVAALTGWPYAEIWVADGASTLRCLDVVRADRPGYAAFEAATRAMVISAGDDNTAVAQAFASRAPRLFPDLDRFVSPRSALGAAAGFSIGVVLPVFAHGAPLGAIAFFSAATDDQDWFHVVEEQRQTELLFERRFAQEALAASADRYRLLFESSPAAMWIYEPGTLRFLDVNQVATRLYGFSREEFLAMTLRDVRPPSEVETLLRVQASAGTSDWRTGSWEHRRKDGSSLHVNVASHGLSLDGREVRVAVITDLTVQRQGADKLREQATLLDSANDAIVVRRLDGVVTFWNRGAERSYGYPAQEAIGGRFQQLTSPRTETYAQAMHDLTANGEWLGEMVHTPRGAAEIVLATRWTYVRDPHGEASSILSIGTDVTERKKLEAQSLRAQRMESIGTLAGGIAHDLNNVLTPILMSIEMLRRPGMTADEVETVDAIETSAQRGADMVKQVLLFARGLSGERVPVPPASLLRDTFRIARESIPKSIEVRIEAGKDLPWIDADATQLQQVLINMAVNARDAMPDGGVLTLSAQAIFLDGGYVAMNANARVGPYVVLEVTDSGHGIPAGIRDRIFDPFFTTKDVGKGTGLGLSTSLAIIKAHGGFINVYSEPEQGTTFRVYLPALSPQAEPTGPAPAAIEAPHGSGELILLVDDEPGIRSVARRTLELAGYAVVEAGNGAEALAEFARSSGKVRLAVVDMSMPVMDGAATIRALHHLDPKVRILSSSGLGANGAFAKAASAGVRHFLQKPYTAASLLTMVQQALQE